MKNEKRKGIYNISEKVLDQFDERTKARAINRSALIEILMVGWIEKCDSGVYKEINME